MFSGGMTSYREDETYDRVISMRREREKERQQRIFNPRIRLMGIDVSALDAQTRERRAREAVQALEDAEYDRRMIMVNRYLSDQEREYHRARIAREIEVAKYNLEKVRPEFTAEYDLYDRDILKKEQPIRISDEDMRLGVSSGQIFDGEDLKARERERAQVEEQRRCLELQIAEKAARKATEEAEKKQDERTQLEVCEYLREKERLWRADQLLARDEIARENQILAEERKRREQEQREKDDEEKKRHMEYYSNCNLLMEKPSGVVKNNIGVPVTEFKGFSAERTAQFLKDVEQQNVEHRDRTRAEIEDKIREDALHRRVANALSLADAQNTLRRKELEIQLAAERAAGAEKEQTKRLEATRNAFGHIDNDEFYKYFQKDTR